MFRIQSLVRGALLVAAVALLSGPSMAQAHHGGCFPTVSYCQPCYTQCYTPCYRPLVYSQPLFVQPCVQPIFVQPCVKPIIVTPYFNSGYRIIVR